MEFEEALVAELESISGLSGKVVPAFAAAGTVAPYVMYESSFGQQIKALSGFLTSKAVEVELNLLAASYAEMKRLQADIITRLTGFEQRVIGDDGPFVQELTYGQPAELYESAPKLHRCVISFEVHF
ncbi:DUF3168 domain-containing protein [Paenibacillus thailandensis]|uniref:DUF3168 domain-containing protein n=1 Tax=Paenibacillus thailandensis TaxID=393250 RepID=A0ABW5QTB6_9BACL